MRFKVWQGAVIVVAAVALLLGIALYKSTAVSEVSTQVPASRVSTEGESVELDVMYPDTWGEAEEIETYGATLLTLWFDEINIHLQNLDGARQEIGRANTGGWCVYDVASEGWQSDRRTPSTRCVPEIEVLNNVPAHGFSRPEVTLFGYSYGMLTEDGRYLIRVDRNVSYPSGIYGDAEIEAQARAEARAAALELIDLNEGLFATE